MRKQFGDLKAEKNNKSKCVCLEKLKLIKEIN